jgi:hypothetical protein
VTRIVIELPESIAEVLRHEARRLLLGRRAYIRYLLAAVASQADAATATRPGELEGNRAPFPRAPENT